MDKLEQLELSNICDGSLPELFERELASVVANILDPNTPPEKARKITVELSFEPFRDRSGAQIELKLTTKLAGSESVKSNMFIHRAGGKNYALPRDGRQQEIFGRGTGPTKTEREDVQ